MTFSRKFPVGRLDFGLRRIRLDAQNSVVVDHCASLNSESQRWMPGCLRTPRHSPKKYTTVCKYYGLFNVYSDVEFDVGGCQRVAGEIPRAAFEGARTLK